MSEGKLTHIRKLVNPNYLGAHDLLDGEDRIELDRIISKVVKGPIRGGTEDAIICHFTVGKPMICNTGNLNRLIKATKTPFVERMQGKAITLYLSYEKSFGGKDWILRVKAGKLPAKAKPQFTEDNFSKAKEAGASIEAIKKIYSLTSETEAKYLDYVK